MSQTVLNPILTSELIADILVRPVAAQTHVFPGTLLAENGSGLVTYATDTAGLVVVGRCEQDIDNTLDLTGGALSVQIKRGVFKYFNSGTNAFSAATPIGTWAYVQDEQTVATTSTNLIKAGIFLGLDAGGKVIIDTRYANNQGSVQSFAQTQSSITDSSTGTAAAPVAGVRTIAAVTSVGTAANAIADIAAELNLIKADILALRKLI